MIPQRQNSCDGQMSPEVCKCPYTIHRRRELSCFKRRTFVQEMSKLNTILKDTSHLNSELERNKLLWLLLRCGYRPLIRYEYPKMSFDPTGPLPHHTAHIGTSPAGANVVAVRVVFVPY